MVIECTACHTRFKLADDKVKPGGTKVRCSKCKHIFTVLPPAPEPPPPSAPAREEEEVDFGDFNMERLSERPKEKAGRNEFAFEKEEEAPGGPTFDREKSEEFTLGAGKEEAGPEEFAFEEEKEAPSEPPFATEESEEFALGGEEAAGSGEFAFEEEAPEEFSFETGEEKGAEDEFAFEESAGGTKADFSWEADESGEGEDEFDFGEGEETAEPFDLSGITFGDEEPAAEIPIEEKWAAPLGTQPAVAEPETPRPMEPPSPERSAPQRRISPPVSAPPLRRRKSPVRLATLLVLLLLALAGGAVYLYWQGGIPELTSLVDRLTGQAALKSASGQIRLEGLTSYYVTNPQAGQLLVIQGQAVNSYPETRSSIAVKGVLFDKGGKALLQQTVFCGNPLDQQTLQNLPFARIEENMNNPFGESLSNLNVAPGKALPFTIVFRNLPAGVAEFTVEVADSKPGTKQ